MRFELEVHDVPSSVEARFEVDGRLTPLAFDWQGRRMPVAACGRTWSTGQGEQRFCHYLVMTAAGDVLELSVELRSLRWRIVRGRARHCFA